MKPLVEGPQEDRKRRPGNENDKIARVWIAIGAAIAVLGWLDILLIWYPLQFGAIEWEFATISAHLEGMPLGTVGLAFIGVGAIRLRWRRTLKGLSIASAVVVFVLLALLILYALAVPVALSMAPEALKSVLTEAVFKAAAFFLTYLATYAWFARHCWKAARQTS